MIIGTNTETLFPRGGCRAVILLKPEPDVGNRVSLTVVIQPQAQNYHNITTEKRMRCLNGREKRLLLPLGVPNGIELL